MCSNESDRQQFHYSARNGWLNDPNGLFWKDGVYHPVSYTHLTLPTRMAV